MTERDGGLGKLQRSREDEKLKGRETENKKGGAPRSRDSSSVVVRVLMSCFIKS